MYEKIMRFICLFIFGVVCVTCTSCRSARGVDARILNYQRRIDELERSSAEYNRLITEFEVEVGSNADTISGRAETSTSTIDRIIERIERIEQAIQRLLRHWAEVQGEIQTQSDF